jgi:hypothetical protein
VLAFPRDVSPVAVRSGAVWLGSPGYGLVSLGMTWCGVARADNSTELLRRLPAVLTRNSRGLAWLGEVWRGMVRLGEARCGGVWHGGAGLGLARADHFSTEGLLRRPFPLPASGVPVLHTGIQVVGLPVAAADLSSGRQIGQAILATGCTFQPFRDRP